MSIAQSLLPEFDQECQTTRRVLERVPDDKFSYQPHPKSMAMGYLASHITEMIGWLKSMATEEGINFEGWKPFNAESNAALLAAFDENVKAGRAALAAATDEQLMSSWSLKNGDQTLMTMPKIGAIRVVAMNHVFHHRGQLSVYLRLNDIPVPSIYGPSADEGKM
ncbi:MAG: DinB family protein [Candidatus Solibacter usitatus]|nr:DinB family protein [Candidatus Solibacter usitatus]